MSALSLSGPLHHHTLHSSYDAVHGEHTFALHCHNRFIWSLSLLWIKDQLKGEFPLSAWCIPKTHPAVRLQPCFVLHSVSLWLIYSAMLSSPFEMCKYAAVDYISHPDVLSFWLSCTQQVWVVLVEAIAQSSAGALLCYCVSHKRVGMVLISRYWLWMIQCSWNLKQIN